jgi:drug/metabolite transporter (DMT)-like permease
MMVVAAFFFAAMTASVKVARNELGPLDLTAWRAIIAIPLALLLAGRGRMDVGNRRIFLFRSVFGFFGVLCFNVAAAGLSVADLALIGKLQPLVVGLLAPMLLGKGEGASAAAWLALMGGLAGSAMLIGPDLTLGSTFGLWAMLGSMFSAGAHLSVRALGRTEEPTAVVLWFQISLLVLSLATLLLFEGRLPVVPTIEVWPSVVITGVASVAGQYFMTRAYQLDRAALVAGASYAGPIWALLIDLVVFRSVPTFVSLLGGALIVVSGIVFLRRG